MRYLAAYMLLVLAGKESPGADEIKELLSGCEIEVDEEKISTLISKLEGKNIDELIEAGAEKLMTVGGAVGGGGGAGGGAGGEGGEEKEEEKKEEEEEEAIDVGGGALFGDADDGY